MWGDPHIDERPNYQYPDSAQILMWDTEIGNHAAGCAPGPSVAEKELPVVAGAVP